MSGMTPESDSLMTIRKSHYQIIAHPYVLLALIQFFSFGIFSWHLGVYHDDWAIIELLARGNNFLATLRVLAQTTSYWARPMGMPVYAFIYTLNGMHYWAYPVLVQILQTAEGILLGLAPFLVESC